MTNGDDGAKRGRPASPAARERLLLALGAAARPSALKGLSETAWGEILDLARRNAVTPLLHRRLKPSYAHLEVPAAVQEELRKSYLMSGIRNTRLLGRLTPVLAALKTAGIDVVALKGVHLAELVYEEVALRPMVDVDLLVRPADLRPAAHQLRALGYGQGESPGARESGHQDPIDENQHLTPFQRPAWPTIELHYAIEIPERRKNVDSDGLWARAVRVPLAGTDALVLSPEDLLLHLCTHTALHHAFSVNLLHLWDIPVVVNRFGNDFDWTAFCHRARTWGVERAVLATFGVTERLLGWRRPEGVPRDFSLPADPFDVVALCETLLFDESGSRAHNSNVVRLWSDAGWREKGKLLVQRLFPSRAELGFAFGLPAHSPRVPFLYAVRAWQLVTRYAATVLRALRKDGATLASFDVGAQRNRLADWLDGA